MSYLYVVLHDTEVLQQRMAALEQEKNEYVRLKQQLEAEFNQKRAKFKELYLSKEGRDYCLTDCVWINHL